MAKGDVGASSLRLESWKRTGIEWKGHESRFDLLKRDAKLAVG